MIVMKKRLQTSRMQMRTLLVIASRVLRHLAGYHYHQNFSTVSPVGPSRSVTYNRLISVYLRYMYLHINILTTREITVSLIPFTLSPITQQHGTQVTAVVSSCFNTVSQFWRVYEKRDCGSWEQQPRDLHREVQVREDTTQELQSTPFIAISFRRNP